MKTYTIVHPNNTTLNTPNVVVRDFLTEDDLAFLAQDVVDTHPGLEFLHDSPPFIPRYVATVVARILYRVDASWSGRVSLRHLRRDKERHGRASLLDALRRLQDSDDINLVTDFFSYEHFYVIYCKFWELDRDHDLRITKEELASYHEHAISARMVDRIFSNAVHRTDPGKSGFMNYKDFVAFILSCEDKNTTKAVEYWFRCMDLDGDGKLSMYELEYFYEEQLRRLVAMSIEPLAFEDLLCQMLDLVHPADPAFVTLADLKAELGLVHVFFDTFFDLEKYLEHEQKDPFAVANSKALGRDGRELSAWERFALEEYNVLVAEDGADVDDEDDDSDAERRRVVLERRRGVEDYEDDFEVDELSVDEGGEDVGGGAGGKDGTNGGVRSNGGTLSL